MKWLAFLIILQLSACGQPQEEVYQPVFGKRPDNMTREYTVGILPHYNPQRLLEVYGPLLDQLSTQIPAARFRLETSLNNAEFDKKLNAGHFDLALANPYEALLALKQGYRVFAKMGDDASFRGLILTRRNSGIRTIDDLKGKRIAYPAPTALAATMMPQYFLHTHGIDANLDTTNVYLGSPDSVILEVLAGHVAAGGIGPIPWRKFIQEHPEQASQLEVKWQTEPLINNAWLARQDVTAGFTEKFAAELQELAKNPAGIQILSQIPVSHFESANNASYADVRTFLDTFSRSVREIER